MRRRSDGALFALKYINKEQCLEKRALRNAVLERDMLASLSHPLIVNMHYAFQDEEHLFMVLDLMLGGDLKHHLRGTGAMLEEAVVVMAGEMACAIGHLHAHGIIHRDVKADNFLLDAAGHVHLTDFNVATLLPPAGGMLTSLTGTLSYMAPEVVLRAGYREQVDWWSLGVLLYELLFGRRPFCGRNNKEIAASITGKRLTFPASSRHVSRAARAFIARLLVKDPRRRLASLADVQREAFFVQAAFDWEACAAKRAVPVFVPDCRVANFDVCHAVEEAYGGHDLKAGRRPGGDGPSWRLYRDFDRAQPGVP